MTDSFALNSNGGVVLQQPAPASNGVATQIGGGGENRPASMQAPVAPGGDWGGIRNAAQDASAKTLDALNTLSNGFIQPYVVQKQREAYFDGMSKVVQGQALVDIEHEQPWYTKIFGPSATVQGAQAMTAITSVAQAQNEFMGAMPELREQSPDQVRQYLVQQAVKIGNTGDPFVDSMVQAKIAEQWGPMLDTHMRQHLAWQQEDAGKKFVNMQVANGSLLQSTLHAQSGANVPQAQLMQEASKFSDGLARPAGMTDESYGKYMASSARAQLSMGNFEAYTALKNTPDAWNAIPMDARVALESEEELWTQRSLRKSPVLSDLALGNEHLSVALSNGAYQGTEQDLLKLIDTRNADWRKRTGASTDMIDNTARNSLVKLYYAGQAKINAAYAKAQEGLSDDQAQRTDAMTALNNGSLGSVSPKLEYNNAQLALGEAWNKTAQDNDPQSLQNTFNKFAAVSSDSRFRFKPVEEQIRQDAEAVFTGGPITKREQQSLGWMQMLLASPTGPAALANYIGADNAAQVQAFIKSGVDIDDPKSLQEHVKMVRDGFKETVTEADRKASVALMSSQDPGWFKKALPQWLGGGAGELTGYDLNDWAKASLANDLAPYTAMVRKAFPGVSQEDAAALAFNKVYGNERTVDFLDGVLIKGSPFVPGAKTLFQGVQEVSNHAMNQHDENYQQAARDAARGELQRTVEERANRMNDAHGIDWGYARADMGNFRPDDYEAIGGEQMGQGKLLLFYRNTKTANVTSVIITPQMVHDKFLAGMNKPSLLDRVAKPLPHGVSGNPLLGGDDSQAETPKTWAIPRVQR